MLYIDIYVGQRLTEVQGILWGKGLHTTLRVVDLSKAFLKVSTRYVHYSDIYEGDIGVFKFVFNGLESWIVSE